MHSALEHTAMPDERKFGRSPLNSPRLVLEFDALNLFQLKLLGSVGWKKS
jgi:hypothetical protein